MLYGKPTKYIRHNTDETYEILPQTYTIIPMWYHDKTYQPADAQDVNHKKIATGSRITKYRVSQTMNPKNPDIPNNFYWAKVQLSFDDIMSPYICGKYIDKDDEKQTRKTFINLQSNEETEGIDIPTVPTNVPVKLQDIRMDDYFKHFITLSKKMTIYNENYIFGDRKMRVPGKCKRGNPYMFYGLYIFNDAPATDTPADNALNYQLEQYFEEWAI